MKKTYTQNDINQFFNVFKKLPDNYIPEKVHQLINNPNIKARHKVKSNFKLIKFIGMTSVFIIGIVSIVVWMTPDSIDKQLDKNAMLNIKLAQVEDLIKKDLVKAKYIEQKKNESYTIKHLISSEPKVFEIVNGTTEPTSIKENHEIQLSEVQNKIQLDNDTSILSIEKNKTHFYAEEKIFEGINFIELSKNDYKKIGFKIEIDNIQIRTKGWNIFLSSELIGCQNLGLFKRNKSKIKLEFLSDSKGFQRIKWKIFGDDQNKFNNEYFISKINMLVPIVMRQKTFPEILTEDQVFWFEPSEALFEALPVSIGKQLRIEYNYITADTIDEQKNFSPTCTYFEECKSTLVIENCRLYPNPAKTYTTLEFLIPKSDNGTISLISINGSLLQTLVPSAIFQQGHNSYKFDLSGISAGIYMIMIKSSRGFKTMRLIISN